MRILPKNLNGDPFGFFNIHFLQIIKKLEGGTLWKHRKFRKKSSTVPKENENGDPLVSVLKVTLQK